MSRTMLAPTMASPAQIPRYSATPRPSTWPVVVMIMLSEVVVLLLELAVLGRPWEKARPTNFTHPKLRHRARPNPE